jgi:hypothetical protein
MNDQPGADPTLEQEGLTQEIPPEAPGASPEPSEDVVQGNGHGSVEDRLRAGYKAGQGERRKTIEIAPGRYHDLAAEFKPIDWDLRRRLIRQAGKRGEGGHEADLRINSQLMAEACLSMMFRPAPGQDYAPLHTLVDRFKGGEPVRFDERLAQVLGIELIGGESEGDICRLVFGDPGVFEAHYMILNGWSLQAFDDDPEDEEDEGGGERPT